MTTTLEQQFAKMTDEDKLQYYILKINNATVDFFSKKITLDIFISRFTKYSNYVDYYKKKLNVPMDYVDEQTNGNELLQKVSDGNNNNIIPK
jgi:hypothetical protein